MLSRRNFLDRGALALAGVALAPVLGRGWVGGVQRQPDLLVAVVLRGGADGLGMVVPFGEREYYRRRPMIAVPPPCTRGAECAIDLDGFFALHPRLVPLLPLYRDGSLAIVHACGLPGATRSHLVEQERLSDLLCVLSAARAKAGAGGIADLTSADPPVPPPWRDVHYPASALGRSLHRIARAARAARDVRTAIVESGQWDHHVAQGGTGGTLATRLDDLAHSLLAFTRDLGSRMADTTIVTVSEFGRSVAENADGGTDHGTATAMLVIGGGLRGGAVHGRWPGLDRDALSGGTGLDATTDVREVMAGITALPALVRPSATGSTRATAPRSSS